MSNFGPQLLPVEPYFQSEAERVVWTHLREQLPSDAFLLGPLRIEDSAQNSLETDVIVIWPGVGIAVIEVKGGHIQLTSAGEWSSSDGREKHAIDPFGQAKRCRDALYKWIKDKLHLPQMRMVAMVAIPYSSVPVGFDRINEPRAHLIDTVDLPTIADRVRGALVKLTGGPQPPSAEAAERLATSLAGGLLDPNNLAQMGQLVGDRNTQVETLVRSQEQLLENLRMLNRFEVRGAAGTGKTALALAQARRLSCSGQRVLLLCFNRLLSRDLRRKTEAWPARERPAVVKNFHDLAASWHGKMPAEADEDYYEVQAAKWLFESAQSAPTSEKFDSIVIDEAQDFASDWWVAIQALLRDPETGGIFAFTDDDQRIFNREGTAALHLSPICLTTNLRNTKPIATTAAAMIENPPKILNFDGAPVIFIDCPRSEALDRADAMADILFDDWEPNNIVLLTTGSKHPYHEEQLALDPSGDAYERSLWDSDYVFYATVMRFKGMERPAAVIAVNGFMEYARPTEVLYVALTRARDLCVICGDAKEIEAIVGAEVMSHWQWRSLEQ